MNNGVFLNTFFGVVLGLYAFHLYTEYKRHESEEKEHLELERRDALAWRHECAIEQKRIDHETERNSLWEIGFRHLTIEEKAIWDLEIGNGFLDDDEDDAAWRKWEKIVMERARSISNRDTEH